MRADWQELMTYGSSPTMTEYSVQQSDPAYAGVPPHTKFSLACVSKLIAVKTVNQKHDSLQDQHNFHQGSSMECHEDKSKKRERKSTDLAIVVWIQSEANTTCMCHLNSFMPYIDLEM